MTKAQMRSHYLFDVAAWAIALAAANFLRFDFTFEWHQWIGVPLVIVASALVQLIVAWSYHLYRGRHAYGSFDEVRALASTVVVTALIVSVPLLLVASVLSVPRSLELIAAPIALLLMFSIRYVRRVVAERRLRPGTAATPSLIYGAGYVGDILVRRMMTDAASPYRPVGIVDDDPSKQNWRIRNVPVRGTLSDLDRIAEETGAKVLVVAIARADATLMRRVQDVASDAGLQVKVMPPLADMLGGRTHTRDIRDISIEDVIGRHPVDTDVASIAGYLAGRRVMVTGAGGSIGAELCRQIQRFQPAELIMLDRDETGLQQAQLGTFGHGLLHTNDVVLCDIRDAVALRRVFEDRTPDVVFHAAALKHLPMLEQYPDEAWKTNVLGTLNVLEAARDTGVTTFVNVSTDKAANPTSVLGHSKRVAEKLTAWVAEETSMRYLSVRFGNVIGSRGSMLPTFVSLIQSGGPVTVTHPDATRFFMTIPEACQLVIQAGAIGEGGEVLILEMGEPVRILDVAERMIAMSGEDISIVFTGLREGEKLHEELVGAKESVTRPIHPKISHARVGPIDPERLDKRAWLDRMLKHARSNDAVSFPFLRAVSEAETDGSIRNSR